MLFDISDVLSGRSFDRVWVVYLLPYVFECICDSPGIADFNPVNVKVGCPGCGITFKASNVFPEFPGLSFSVLFCRIYKVCPVCVVVGLEAVEDMVSEVGEVVTYSAWDDVVFVLFETTAIAH